MVLILLILFISRSRSKVENNARTQGATNLFQLAVGFAQVLDQFQPDNQYKRVDGGSLKRSFFAHTSKAKSSRQLIFAHWSSVIQRSLLVTDVQFDKQRLLSSTFPTLPLSNDSL